MHRDVMMFSPALRRITLVDEGTRQFAISKIWDHIKEQNLYCPENRAYFYPDEILEPIFGKALVPCFSISRQLMRHMFWLVRMTSNILFKQCLAKLYRDLFLIT